MVCMPHHLILSFAIPDSFSIGFELPVCISPYLLIIFHCFYTFPFSSQLVSVFTLHPCRIDSSFNCSGRLDRITSSLWCMTSTFRALSGWSISVAWAISLFIYTAYLQIFTTLFGNLLPWHPLSPTSVTGQFFCACSLFTDLDTDLFV